MTRFDNFLAYAEANRLTVCGIAGVLVAIIAWTDWTLPNISVGFLYLIPVLLAAPALKGIQIVCMALVCGYFREAFDPLQSAASGLVPPAPVVLNPARWVPGSVGRMLVVTVGFMATGFFVAELNQRRRLLSAHLQEREEQMRLRQDAEHRLRILIETSPLAILTLDQAGRVLLSNESARQLLGFEEKPLHGESMEPYLPILARMLHHDRGGHIRTNVECKGHRRSGEVFLAHVWLSTYPAPGGPGLAAVVWDASENLRDREGAGLDSMMATSRVLIGAISHEIRNLASAASAAHAALQKAGANGDAAEQHQALGSLIQGLEKIASSGLRMASDREAVVADLGTVLDEARVVIEPVLREAGISVVWDLSDGLPLVQADHHGLLQVFLNLARNSQRALEGRANPEVRISTALESDLVLVRFHDSGPGVAHPEELFRPFQRGADASGIGLYISRAILRAHGGGLRYEPQARGSCFAVELWPVENASEGKDISLGTD